MRYLLVIASFFIAGKLSAQDSTELKSAFQSSKQVIAVRDIRDLSFSEIHYVPMNDINRIRVSIHGAWVGSEMHTNSYPVTCDEILYSDQVAFRDANYLRIPGKYRAGIIRQKFTAFLVPAFDIGVGSQFEPSGNVSDMGYGASIGINLWKKVSLQGSFLYTTSTLAAYNDSLRKQLDLIPSIGDFTQKGKSVAYINWIGSLSYKPNKYIRLEIGRGKNFLGEGYRSVFLSDNASPYPYGKITTRIWKIKYTNLYLLLSDKRNVNGDVTSTTQTKFTSIHHLSWNLGKRVNLSFFESIVWQSKDTLHNRQFDVTYLNPVIFYRPVEYGLGSSDNAIIGMGIKVKPASWISIYGNAVIDEFLLSELRADSGWWANKYALQGGIKITHPFHIPYLYLQAEYTYARPFTWSHGSVLQNYGHMNQPLAHPLGSNFKETVVIAQYSWKRFYINETAVFYLHGADSSVANYGGDIYRSYRDRQQDYHNYTGQGLKQNVFVHRLTVGWEVYAASALRIELTHMYRNQQTSGFADITNHYFMVSLRTNLFEKNVLR